MRYRAALDALLGMATFLAGLFGIYAVIVVLWALTAPVPQ